MENKSPPNDQMSGIDVDGDGGVEKVEVVWQISAVLERLVYVKRLMPSLNRPVSEIGRCSDDRISVPVVGCGCRKVASRSVAKDGFRIEGRAMRDR